MSLNFCCTQGKKARSIAEMRNVLAHKKQKITHGLPEWGKDLPQDVGTEIELIIYGSMINIILIHASGGYFAVF